MLLVPSTSSAPEGFSAWRTPLSDSRTSGLQTRTQLQTDDIDIRSLIVGAGREVERVLAYWPAVSGTQYSASSGYRKVLDEAIAGIASVTRAADFHVQVTEWFSTSMSASRASRESLDVRSEAYRECEAGGFTASARKVLSFAVLPVNWDGYGAKPIPSRAVTRSLHLLGLQQFQIYPPEVFPTGRESVQFEYEKPDGSYLEFEVFADRIEAFEMDPEDNVVFDEIVADTQAAQLVRRFAK